jgi:glycerophosphoryl diester phosphodiesterase
MPSPPLLLGHRGARAARSVPENTFASFDLALEHGCDGFEFDVRLTGCGRALVCHDPRVGSITVSRATRDQLLDLPRLEDVLERYGHRVFLDIEVKVSGLEPKVLAALRERAPQRDYVVSSFIPEVVMELKARSAVIPLGIICERPSQLARWRRLPVDYVMAHKSLVDRKLVDEVHGAGRRLFAWTINDKPSMLRLAGWGADGIISDETELLVHTLT